MAITSALSTSLTGLSANQAALNVIGNNIANVNTTGFKASALDFKTEFSQNFSYGSAPNGNNGGSNPIQVGMGVQQGAITRNFGDGSTVGTGVDSNLAIQGDGFFILQGPTTSYTRDGNFQLNANNELVNADGLHVQGFGVDANFNVVPGVLQNLTIPLGTMTIAQATTNIPVSGNLNASGVIPSAVSTNTLDQPLYVTNGSGGTTGTAPTAATLLSQLTDANGNPLFASGETLGFGGTRGVSSTGNTTTSTQTIATQSLPVTATTTLGDLLNFMQGTAGIDTSTGANGSIATTPGAALIAGPAGAAQIQINGNVGTANSIALDPNSLSITNAGTTTNPFSWTNVPSDGESISTATTIYDSLGTPLAANVTLSLSSKTNAGTTWQFYATSPNGSATGPNIQDAIGTGTISFDTNGDYLSSTNNSATINRANTGATPNLTFSIDFSHLTAQSNSTPGISISTTPGTGGGAPTGTLVSYSIGGDGIITGKFDNSLQRSLGQVALATFRNDEGLVDLGDNNFAVGANSGTPIVSAPGQFSAGKLTPDALENSNVDLSAEFVKLISASTGFSAASRVITTANQLLQSLLASVQG